MYVQTHCNDDIEKLMSSGFLPVSTNRTSSPISTPVITSLEQDNGGQLVAVVKKIRNVRSHHLRFVPVGADGRPAGDWKVVQGLTNTRSMAINGLVPGTTYMVQVRALSVILETMVPTEAAAIIRLVQSLSAPLHVTFEETTQAEWLWNARI